MIINGVSLNLDISDADVFDAVEVETGKVFKKTNDMPDLSAGDSIRYQCDVIADFFNAVFGDGTADAVLKNKKSLTCCLDAFDVVIEDINRQNREMDERIARYSANRGGRRAR